MQKPLSTSLDEAEQFVQASEASDRTVLALPFICAAARAHRPRVDSNRKTRPRRFGALAIQPTAVPEVYYATIQNILGEEPEDDLWFFDADKAGRRGRCSTWGVYAIAHLVVLLGSVTSVSCRRSTVAKPTQLEDTAAPPARFRKRSHRHGRNRLDVTAPAPTTSLSTGRKANSSIPI